MKPSEILIEARKLIDTPDKWTTGCLARTKGGQSIRYSSEHAACFCALGAIYRANRGTYEQHRQPSDNREMEREAERAIQLATKGNVPEWNDAPERTHDEVLEAYDIAIAALVAEGQ